MRDVGREKTANFFFGPLKTPNLDPFKFKCFPHRRHSWARLHVSRWLVKVKQIVIKNSAVREMRDANRSTAESQEKVTLFFAPDEYREERYNSV